MQAKNQYTAAAFVFAWLKLLDLSMSPDTMKPFKPTELTEPSLFPHLMHSLTINSSINREAGLH